MSIAFELTPEGQAWNDYNAQPLNQDDLTTPFLSGTLSAGPRGLIRGAMGLPETVASGYEKITHDYEPVSDEKFYSFSYALKNSANRLFGGFVERAERSKEIIKPDALSQGTAAQVLQGVGEFTSSIVAAVATGPIGGGLHAFGTTYESVNQEMQKQGVDSVTARNVALQQAGFNAFGFALPAGIGGSLATRVSSGAGINIGFGAGSRYASGAILEANGYDDMASQYKVWDAQAIIIDTLLGAAFGYAYHLGAPKQVNKQLDIPEFLKSENIKPSDIDAAHVLNEGRYYDLESSPVLHSSPKSLNAHDAAMEKAGQQMLDGDSVYVHEEVQGIEGILHTEAERLGKEYHNDMELAFKENDIVYSQPRTIEETIPEVNQNSSFVRTDHIDISRDIETGEIISSNNYDLIQARELANSYPELTVAHPDTGETISLNEALRQFDEQITTAKNEAHVYDVAASCFLRNA